MQTSTGGLHQDTKKLSLSGVYPNYQIKLKLFKNKLISKDAEGHACFKRDFMLCFSIDGIK